MTVIKTSGAISRLCLFSSVALTAVPQDLTSVRQLVFTANVSGNWDLFVSGPDGSRAAQLTRTAIDELSPAIAPDGSRVAYATSDGALWTMTLATRKTGKIPLPP